jgi:hypothetical protein
MGPYDLTNEADLDRMINVCYAGIKALKAKKRTQEFKKKLLDIDEIVGLLSEQVDEPYLRFVIGLPEQWRWRLGEPVASLSRRDALYVIEQIARLLHRLSRPFKFDTGKEKEEEIKLKHRHRTTVKAQEWVATTGDMDLKDQIVMIWRLLDDVAERISQSNEPKSKSLLTELERKTLIMILEATLSTLRSPMVEIGILKEVGAFLKRTSQKAAEKSIQTALGKLMGEAGIAVFEFIKQVGRGT